MMTNTGGTTELKGTSSGEINKPLVGTYIEFVFLLAMSE